jgi:hypothetical protein
MSSRRLTPLSPRLLVATAWAQLGAGGQRRRCDNETIASLFSGAAWKEGRSWSAAFVHHVGDASHYDLFSRTSNWPVPTAASCDGLLRFAKAEHILVQPAEDGDLYLGRSRDGTEIVRVGIVVSVTWVDGARGIDGPPALQVETIEGNVTSAGSPGGRWISLVTHRVEHDAEPSFVRWVDLDQSRVLGNPAAA